MKAVRGAEIKLDSLHYKPTPTDDAACDERLASHGRPAAVHRVRGPRAQGVSVEHIHDITKIDEWFLCKLKNLADYEAEIQGQPDRRAVSPGQKATATRTRRLARLAGAAGAALRHRLPSYKMVDTCAAEFARPDPLFLLHLRRRCATHGTSPAHAARPTVIVLGSGPIRIGQGIEFDYCSVHCVWTLEGAGL